MNVPLERKMYPHMDAPFGAFCHALPASTLVQVTALVQPELTVEIEAIARLGQ
jgi:enamine deaminase RidA (YjgF/YER057c/UK114 family)